ncbi:MAG TPA: hypothetical protein VJT81_18915 [Burkholderiales bacterium]|nr:hypothetical protein [Burkholderiales bacterium]
MILGYGILTHGVIVLNDGLYWDGWLVDVWQQNKDKNSMRRFYSEVGMPYLYFEHSILGRFPSRNLAYRAISLFSILSIAVFVFLTAVHTNVFNPLQAAVIALLLLSYPAYAVTFDGVASLQYTFKIALFYVACFCAVTTIGNSDSASMAVFALSLVLLFFSFNANSLLVYIWGFLLFYSWLVYSSTGFSRYEVAKVVLLAMLPFSYWLLKETFAPRHGYYKNYNTIRITPFSAVKTGLQAFRYGIDVPMIKPVLEVVQWKNAFTVLASIAIGSLLFDYGIDLWAVQKVNALAILAAGYVLAFLGALPFILVGQVFYEGGWTSKNCMLLHLPFALVVLGWLQFVPDSFGIVLIPIILLANAVYIVKIHLLYIAISVKDKALIRWFSANPQLSSASVIKIRESHWIEYPFERLADMYRPAYLSCMVKRIWPESRILAILDDLGSSAGRSLTAAEIEQALEETTIRYSFAPQVQPGPQYLITITATTETWRSADTGESFHVRREVSPLKQPAMVRMAFQYLYRKWLSPHRLDSLFEQHFAFSASEL